MVKHQIIFRHLKSVSKLNDFAGTEYRDVNFLTGEFEEKEISENCKLLKHVRGKEKVRPLTELKNIKISK